MEIEQCDLEMYVLEFFKIRFSTADIRKNFVHQ